MRNVEHPEYELTADPCGLWLTVRGEELCLDRHIDVQDLHAALGEYLAENPCSTCDGTGRIDDLIDRSAPCPDCRPSQQLSAEELLKVEHATTERGEFIGLRLTLGGSGRTSLVFADQQSMPGFRVGSEFVPQLGEVIDYTILATPPAEHVMPAALARQPQPECGKAQVPDAGALVEALEHIVRMKFNWRESTARMMGERAAAALEAYRAQGKGADRG